jgi:hypothetical protein
MKATETADEGLLARIKDHAVRELSWHRSQTTNLHIEQKVFKKGSVIQAYKQRIPVAQNSVLVFADDAPLLNWAHACRYLIYDAKSGRLAQEVHAQFPPYLVKTPDSYQVFHEPVRVAYDPRLWYVRPWLRCPIRFPLGERYAVLYSGASNNRHTNDLEFLYRTLRDLYGFRDDHIYCLNYDGTINYNGGPATTWPGDNTAYRMPVHGKGTKADLEGVFDDLKKRLKKNDLLLVHTNNHGGYDGPGKAYLCTYSGPSYYAADFANKLAELPAYNTLMVMMEQCHSGGFNAPILAKSTASLTTVASACVEPNNSIGGANFDPFARDWIAAMAGHTPSGGALASNPDTDGNGRIYAREAFAYADAVHDPYDTPVYSESSSAAGDTRLGQRYRWWWWYCPLVVKLLEPIYLRLPIPEFYEKLHELAPQFEEIERLLDKDDKDLKGMVEGRLQALFAKAF